jgi:hypothetical protein
MKDAGVITEVDVPSRVWSLESRGRCILDAAISKTATLRRPDKSGRVPAVLLSVTGVDPDSTSERSNEHLSGGAQRPGYRPSSCGDDANQERRYWQGERSSSVGLWHGPSSSILTDHHCEHPPPPRSSSDSTPVYARTRARPWDGPQVDCSRLRNIHHDLVCINVDKRLSLANLGSVIAEREREREREVGLVAAVSRYRRSTSKRTQDGRRCM